METGVPKLHFETPILSRGDGELWLSISKMPLTDLKNNVVGILSSYEDITDRRKAEQKAAERNLRLTRLTELSLTLSGDPDEVFQNAARMIGELLNVRFVCLFVVCVCVFFFVCFFVVGLVLVVVGFCVFVVLLCFVVVCLCVV